MPTDPTSPLLRIRNLLKVFPGLTALDQVSLDVHAGEVVAVLGHNGSGKSTLVKVLAGVYDADGGTVETGEDADLHFIHQDLALIGALSAAENLALMDRTGAGRVAPVSRAADRARTERLIERFGPVFDVTRPVASLTPAQRAVVAISRALDGWRHPRNVLVLDEPTESLHHSEVEILLDAVRRLAADGAGIIFVSHRLDEVFRIADRVVVLRDGRRVADVPVAEIDHDRLVALITGTDGVRSADAGSATAQLGTGEVVLDVAGLRGGTVEHVDLRLRAGEIVGVAGVLGSGRERVPALLSAAEHADADRFLVKGAEYRRRTPRESLRRGIAFVPADRARVGAVGPFTARENLTLPQLRSLTGRFGAISAARERREAARLLDEFDVRPPRAEQRFSLFSGGNQQKIVMARALRDDPRIMLLDEPTQGVDIGTKQTIYDAIRRSADGGTAVLVSSSDAKELLTVCHRVLVMRAGRIAAELQGDDLTESRLVAEGYGLT